LEKEKIEGLKKRKSLVKTKRMKLKKIKFTKKKI